MDNPFVAGQALLRSQIYMKGGQAFNEELSIFMGMLILSLLMIILAVAIRIQRSGLKSVWLFRLERGFVVPHGVYTALAFSSIYIILDLIYITCSKSWAIVGNDMNGATIFRSSVYIPLLFAAWSMSWSTSIQPLKLSSSDSPPVQAIVFNLFFIATPLVLTAIVIALAGMAEIHFGTILNLYNDLDARLTVAIAQYDQTGLANIDITHLLSLKSQLELESPQFVYYWRLSIVFLSVFVFVVIIVTAVSSFVHFLDLRKTMKLLDNRPGGKAQIAALRFSYSSILISTSAVLILEVLYFAITIILACKTAQFTSDPVLGSIITVAAVAVYAIFGLLVNFGFLIRSFQVVRSAQSTTFSKSHLPSTKSQPPTTTFDRKITDLVLNKEKTTYLGGGRKLSDEMELIE